jgi:hypothetical protein
LPQFRRGLQANLITTELIVNRPILTAFTLAAAAWMIAAPSPAQQSPPHGQFVPYVCDLVSQNDVYARYINTGGHFILNVFAGQEDNSDNAGATLDGIDGARFNRLDLDFHGICDGSFQIVYFGASNTEGVSIDCSQAIQTQHGAYTHLTVTPDMFGVPKGDKVIQFCLSQFTTEDGPRSDLITNVQLNGVALQPNRKVTAECQFTTE